MSAFGSDPEAMRRHSERFEFATAIQARALCAMTETEALAHAKDMLRTRVTPGADPRAGWSSDTADSGITPAAWIDLVAVFESGPRSTAAPWLWFAFGFTEQMPADYRAAVVEGVRYVPCDVCRWRDPEHRAAMTERASKYATERVTYSRAV